MATGASTADLAIVLIDARQGVLTQTRRHSFIASLLGIRHVVLAVNKIDLVDYDQAVFDRIVADYRAFAADLGFATLTPIPISAKLGDNVTLPLGEHAGWYDGPTCSSISKPSTSTRIVATKPFRCPCSM
jgi:bifunctional enzyme CysN/CysC